MAERAEGSSSSTTQQCQTPSKLITGREARRRLGGANARMDVKSEGALDTHKERRFTLEPVVLEPRHAASTLPEHQPGLHWNIAGHHINLQIPCHLSLAHSQRARKWPDLRIDLVKLTLDDVPGPPVGPPPAPGSQVRKRRSSRPVGVCYMGWEEGQALQCTPQRVLVHTAALAVAYLMLPDVVGPAVDRLSGLGYVVLVGPLLWGPAGVGECRGRKRAVQLERWAVGVVGRAWSWWCAPGLMGQQKRAGRGDVVVVDGQQGTGVGGCHGGHHSWGVRRRLRTVLSLAQMIAGPAAVLHLGALVVDTCSPSLSRTCQAVVGLLAVMYEYNGLSRDINHGRIRPGADAEVAWHAAHKRAARRVGKYLTSLPPSPPLKPYLDLLQASSLTSASSSSTLTSCALHPPTLTPASITARYSFPYSNINSGHLCLSLSIPCWPLEPTLKPTPPSYSAAPQSSPLPITTTTTLPPTTKPSTPPHQHVHTTHAPATHTPTISTTSSQRACPSSDTRQASVEVDSAPLPTTNHTPTSTSTPSPPSVAGADALAVLTTSSSPTSPHPTASTASASQLTAVLKPSGPPNHTSTPNTSSTPEGVVRLMGNQPAPQDTAATLLLISQVPNGHIPNSYVPADGLPSSLHLNSHIVSSPLHNGHILNGQVLGTGPVSSNGQVLGNQVQVEDSAPLYGPTGQVVNGGHPPGVGNGHGMSQSDSCSTVSDIQAVAGKKPASSQQRLDTQPLAPTQWGVVQDSGLNGLSATARATGAAAPGQQQQDIQSVALSAHGRPTGQQEALPPQRQQPMPIPTPMPSQSSMDVVLRSTGANHSVPTLPTNVTNSVGGVGGVSGGVTGVGCIARMSEDQQVPVVASPPVEEQLMLYGRADHAPPAPPSSITDLLALMGRACRLMVAFTPFITIGTTLLCASALMGPTRTPPHTAQDLGAAAPSPPTMTTINGVTASSQGVAIYSDRASANASDGDSQQEVVVSVGQGGAVTDQTGAVALSGTPLKLRTFAWRLLLLGCQISGAAFIKWGQWAATRGDLFPPDFCDTLGALHDRAPVHSAHHTRQQIKKAFGASVEELFVEFDVKPIASGSVAQVHRALLADPSAPGGVRSVAVKVRHPGVADAIARDFRILKPLAGLTSRVKMLRGLSLRETLSQFSHTMTAQTDLRVEAAHLARAGRDFKDCGGMVCIPKVVPGLVSASVLVETWEEGRSVSHFCKHRTPINTELVALGVDAYLAMLLKHNFVHTDLHPGNIMVRMLDAKGQVVSDEQSGLGQMLRNAQALEAGGTAGQQLVNSSASKGRKDKRQNRQSGAASGGNLGGGGDTSHLRPQLVLLDYGLAEELTPRVRHHFISFLNSISAGNGSLAAKHLLKWSTHQECPDVPAFKRAVQALFREHCNVHSPNGIDLDFVMKSVLRLAMVHQLTIDSSYAALAVAVCVLVGFAASLDPHVNLMDAATPCLLAYSLTGKVMGRLFS